MNIKIIASGSKENCYHISDGETEILIECGCSIAKIRKALDYKLHNISACLISHEHKDHCKSANELMHCGIDCYMTSGTKKALYPMFLYDPFLKKITYLEQFTIGTYTIIAFQTEHDASEPCGFIVYSNVTNKKLLFATDTYYIRFKFANINYYMIECNYSSEILNKRIEENPSEQAKVKRLLRSHFALENVIEFFGNQDLSYAEKIYLIHLSNTNADNELFKSEIQKKTGLLVEVC